MSIVCHLGKAKKLSAYYVSGFLVIRAQGVLLPNPCYKASIKRTQILIFPPEYQLTLCVDTAQICIQPIKELKNVFGIFVVPEYFETVRVHTAAGVEEVKVQKITGSAEGADEVVTLAGVPGLFGEAMVAAPKKKVFATGYHESDPLNFDKAFADAVNNLPPPPPDWIDVIHVVDSGAIIGGFIGERKMFVKIYTTRPS